MSPTRRVPGAAEVKFRPMRSSNTLSGSEGIVVRLNARIRFAAQPFSLSRVIAGYCQPRLAENSTKRSLAAVSEGAV
jgi:hypothetical protein